MSGSVGSWEGWGPGPQVWPKQVWPKAAPKAVWPEAVTTDPLPMTRDPKKPVTRHVGPRGQALSLHMVTRGSPLWQQRNLAVVWELCAAATTLDQLKEGADVETVNPASGLTVGNYKKKKYCNYFLLLYFLPFSFSFFFRPPPDPAPLVGPPKISFFFPLPLGGLLEF